MHAACLVAEFDNHSKVKIAIEVLRKSDFHSDAISLVWKGHEKALEKVDRQPDQLNSLEVKQILGAGTAIALMKSAPLGASSIIQPIMVAGPLAAAERGSPLGRLMNWVSDNDPDRDHSESDVPRGLFAMANHFGIHAHQAAHYEDRILDGAVLVIVTSTPPRLDVAQAVLKTTGPECLKRFAIHHKTEK